MRFHALTMTNHDQEVDMEDVTHVSWHLQETLFFGDSGRRLKTQRFLQGSQGGFYSHHPVVQDTRIPGIDIMGQETI